MPLSKNQEEETTVDNDNDTKPADNEDITNNKPLFASCHKPCHNVTKNVMAHEFLSYRRTLRFDNDIALLLQ